MLSAKNRVVIACAGSRKTTSIVEEALAVQEGRVLLTTYTNENVDQIVSCIVRMKGYVPENIEVLSWFSFLLQEGVRPYQGYMTNRDRIVTINFVALPHRFTPKAETDRYFLTGGGDIYSERVSEFVCACDERSGGRVVKRLEKIYAKIFIDELQDFAGHDFELFDRLFRSSISIIAVGDPRQGTFSTNNASKNKKFKKGGIFAWAQERGSSQVVTVEERTDCYRSNQLICDFADQLYPDLPRTNSLNVQATAHDGIFVIKHEAVPDYVLTHGPTVLRHNKLTDTMGLPAFNIGMMKGKTFDRVLIFPTGPMKAYLKTKDLAKVKDVAKFYVGITRARYSVAFVI